MSQELEWEELLAVQPVIQSGSVDDTAFLAAALGFFYHFTGINLGYVHVEASAEETWPQLLQKVNNDEHYSWPSRQVLAGLGAYLRCITQMYVQADEGQKHSLLRLITKTKDITKLSTNPAFRNEVAGGKSLPSLPQVLTFLTDFLCNNIVYSMHMNEEGAPSFQEWSSSFKGGHVSLVPSALVKEMADADQGTITAQDFAEMSNACLAYLAAQTGDDPIVQRIMQSWPRVLMGQYKAGDPVQVNVHTSGMARYNLEQGAPGTVYIKVPGTSVLVELDEEEEEKDADVIAVLSKDSPLILLRDERAGRTDCAVPTLVPLHFARAAHFLKRCIKKLSSKHPMAQTDPFFKLFDEDEAARMLLRHFPHLESYTDSDSTSMTYAFTTVTAAFEKLDSAEEAEGRTQIITKMLRDEDGEGEDEGDAETTGEAEEVEAEKVEEDEEEDEPEGKEDDSIRIDTDLGTMVLSETHIPVIPEVTVRGEDDFDAAQARCDIVSKFLDLALLHKASDGTLLLEFKEPQAEGAVRYVEIAKDGRVSLHEAFEVPSTWETLEQEALLSKVVLPVTTCLTLLYGDLNRTLYQARRCALGLLDAVQEQEDTASSLRASFVSQGTEVLFQDEHMVLPPPDEDSNLPCGTHYTFSVPPGAVTQSLFENIDHINMACRRNATEFVLIPSKAGSDTKWFLCGSPNAHEDSVLDSSDSVTPLSKWLKMKSGSMNATYWKMVSLELARSMSGTMSSRRDAARLDVVQSPWVQDILRVAWALLDNESRNELFA